MSITKETKGLVYFKDGRTEEVVVCREDLFLDGIRFKCESGSYVRVRELTGEYKYYKSYVNHDWETMYVRVHNIDHVEIYY